MSNIVRYCISTTNTCSRLINNSDIGAKLWAILTRGTKRYARLDVVKFVYSWYFKTPENERCVSHQFLKSKSKTEQYLEMED
jgi:hypothetical protein